MLLDSQNLQTQFGNIDIYLFDQLLKGRFDSCKTVLDAGCGSGRNLIYLLQHQLDVYGIDPNPEAISWVRELAKSLAPDRATENFSVATAECLPFEDAFFDLVICNAVLHFASDEMHFEQMVLSLWRVLKPGGYFSTRLASSIGLDAIPVPGKIGRYFLPDGSERYLVSEAQLMDVTARLNGVLFEPLKTTLVQNSRSMTTWCMQKI